MSEHPLRIYRREKNMTQGDLACVLGISDALVTHIENGRRAITPVRAKNWEALIGIPKEVLCPDVFGLHEVGAANTAPTEREAA